MLLGTYLWYGEAQYQHEVNMKVLMTKKDWRPGVDFLERSMRNTWW